jgi:hypothetical protein
MLGPSRAKLSRRNGPQSHQRHLPSVRPTWRRCGSHHVLVCITPHFCRYSLGSSSALHRLTGGGRSTGGASFTGQGYP